MISSKFMPFINTFTIITKCPCAKLPLGFVFPMFSVFQRISRFVLNGIKRIMKSNLFDLMSPHLGVCLILDFFLLSSIIPQYLLTESCYFQRVCLREVRISGTLHKKQVQFQLCAVPAKCNRYCCL